MLHVIKDVPNSQNQVFTVLLIHLCYPLIHLDRRQRHRRRGLTLSIHGAITIGIVYGIQLSPSPFPFDFFIQRSFSGADATIAVSIIVCPLLRAPDYGLRSSPRFPLQGPAHGIVLALPTGRPRAPILRTPRRATLRKMLLVVRLAVPRDRGKQMLRPTLSLPPQNCMVIFLVVLTFLHRRGVAVLILNHVILLKIW